jgi:membrane protease YdiL (CAAX protease family)
MTQSPQINPEVSDGSQGENFRLGWRLFTDSLPGSIICYVLRFAAIAVICQYGILLATHKGYPHWVTTFEGQDLADEIGFALAAIVSLAATTPCNPLQALIAAGFVRKRIAYELIISFAVGVICTRAIVAVSVALGLIRYSPDVRSFGSVWLLAYTMAIGCAEETAFRGFLLPRIERSFGTAWAVIVSSITFGMLHWWNYSGESPVMHWLWCGCIALSGGIGLAGAYMLHRRLWFPIGMHAAWDCVLYFKFGIEGHSGAYRITYASDYQMMAPFIGIYGSLGAIFLAISMRRGNWLPMPRQPRKCLHAPSLYINAALTRSLSERIEPDADSLSVNRATGPIRRPRND